MSKQKTSTSSTAIIIVITLLIVGSFTMTNYRASKKMPVIAPVITSYKDAIYSVNGTQVKLINGTSEVEQSPGSATKIITTYFGNELKKDLDGDGKEDVAFLLTQTAGGSGTFYYVVAALKRDDSYVGSQGLLIGDRIAPQTTESGKNKTIIINYADRNLSDSFAVQPSVGKSLHLLLDPVTMQFGEVVQNFEGESNR